MTTIIDVSVNAHDLPLQEPFEISLGTRNAARNVLVVIETETGVYGYGEGSPLPPVTGETQQTAIAIAREAASLIEGRDIRNYRRLIRDIRSAFPGMVSALFAVETAILDAYCRERELPLAELFGGTPAPVESDLTIPILAVDEAVERAKAAKAANFTHLKIKTGADVSADIDKVIAIHEAVPDAVLKVDANQGWTPVETERFVAELQSQGVELALLEQPVAKDDIKGLAQVREKVSVPIAADESVFTPADAIRIVREEAADVINVKLGKSGLINSSVISEIATSANLDLMVGCMLESGIGIHTSAHLVSGIGLFDYIDLDGNMLLSEDVIEKDFDPIIDPTGPGHGITPTN